MKPKAYLLIFDGLADWEPALALCEINKSGKFDVTTVGFSRGRITTMGGLKLTPDLTLDDVSLAQAGVFLLPGGEVWERQSFPALIDLLRRMDTRGVLIGALCGATLEVARAGLTRNVLHTSNSLEYLKAMVAGYADESHYVNELAVTGGNLITASGLGSVEFGREVIKGLGIYGEEEAGEWLEMFKPGVVTAGRAV